MMHATIARGLVTLALVFLATWMLHETPATRMTAAEQNLVRGGDDGEDEWTIPGECLEEEHYGQECHDKEENWQCSRQNAYCEGQQPLFRAPMSGSTRIRLVANQKSTEAQSANILRCQL